MNIKELQEYAQKNGFDCVEFQFTNLQGEIKKCKWLDAYFGLFVIEGNNGFITVNQWIDITQDSFNFELL